MSLYRLVVLTDPVSDQEEEFSRWYEDVHLPDVLKVPGVIAAQRFAVSSGHVRKHAAIYELETDDPATTIDEMVSRSGTDTMPLSPALDLERGYEMITLKPSGKRQLRVT